MSLYRVASGLAVLCILLGAGPVQAQIYVNDDASGANTGTSWTNAYTDLQTAINNANGSSVLWVAQGTYTPDNEGDSFTIPGSKDGIKIYGGFDTSDGALGDRNPGENLTILSGDLGTADTDPDGDGVIEDADPDDDGVAENLNGANAHHVVVFDATGSNSITSTTVLDGVTITAGQADGTAAGEDVGGGIVCTAASGVLNSAGCSPTFNRLILVGNYADQRGGGMDIRAEEDGGSTTEPTIRNSLIAGNASGTVGGALGVASLINSTVRPTVENTTFANNSADTEGGAITHRASASGTQIDLQLTNVIIWNNFASTYDAVDGASGENTTFEHCIVEDGVSGIQVSGGVTTVDTNYSSNPDFVDLTDLDGADNTYRSPDDGLRPLTGSVALDNGTSVSFSEDIARNARVQNSTVDIGAYEGAAGPPAIAVRQGATSITDGQATNVNLGSINEGTNLTASITVENTGDLPLNINSESVTGAAFSETSSLPAQLVTGATATFDVTLSGATVGSFTGTVEIDSDASNASLFNFPIEGTVNNVAPTVGTNTGLSVNEGGTATLSDSELNTTDPGDGPANLTYTISTANPVGEGTLRNTNTAADLTGGDTFTQADLNNGYIEYQHDGTEPTSESFDFTVEDTNGGTVIGSFPITINNVPDLTAARGPDDSTYAGGEVLSFQIDYDVPVSISGAPVLELDVGGATRTADVVSGGGTSTLTFEYTIQSDDAASSLTFAGTTITGGTIESTAKGIAADRDFGGVAPDLSGIAVEGTPPTISDVRLGTSISTGGAVRIDTGEQVVLRIKASEVLAPTDAALTVSIDGPNTSDWKTFTREAFTETVTDEDTIYTLATDATYSDGVGRYEAVVDAAVDPVGNEGPSGGSTVADAVRGVTIDVQTGTVAPNTQATVDLTVRGGFAIDDTTFAVRKGGTDAYRSLDLTVEEGLSEGTSGTVRLRTGIPSSIVTTRGVDYYALVVDGTDTLSVPAGGPTAAQNAPLNLPVSFDEFSPPASVVEDLSQEETYRMASVPAAVNPKTVLTDAYGPYTPGEWRALQWDASESTYREFPVLDSTDLRAGNAFWLITAQGTPLSVGSGTTVDASTPRAVEIAPGWNQVGTPFPYPVAWDTVRAGSGFTAAELDGPYRRGSEGYQTDTALRPWRGYFVFNATSSADTLLIPPVGTSGPTTQAQRLASTTRAGDTAKSGAGYTLRVTASAKSGTSTAILGLRSGAKAGRDRYDIARPPSVQPTTQLSVAQTVGKRSVPHAKSVKPAGGDGQSWTLRLRRPEQDDAPSSVRLDWSASGSLPEGQSRYVIDPSSETRVAPGKRFSLDKGETRRLKVIVGTERYAQKNSEAALKEYETALRGNYPNPFDETTTLEYTLSRERAVTMQVYNVLGQRVATLVDDSKRAGLHRTTWDGTNRYGDRVGSGVYFVRMEAGSTTETQKVVLVR